MMVEFFAWVFTALGLKEPITFVKEFRFYMKLTNEQSLLK